MPLQPSPLLLRHTALCPQQCALLLLYLHASAALPYAFEAHCSMPTAVCPSASVATFANMTATDLLSPHRQAPPPEAWASLVNRLLEPLPATVRSRGGASKGLSDRPDPRSGHGTLVEAMDVAQLVDLSAGLVQLRAGCGAR
eukprot:484932-Pelagomonas_calceolata.AAC.1